jgi:hypothetical protein
MDRAILFQTAAGKPVRRTKKRKKPGRIDAAAPNWPLPGSLWL